MMVLSHVAVGGVIGEIANNPYLAFSVALVSHLIIDKIPHFWPKTKKNEEIWKWFDIISSLVMMLCFWLFGYRDISFWAGVAGSVSVDVVTVGIGPIERSKLGQWQKKRQPHLAKTSIITTDMAFVLFSVIYLGLKK